MNISNTYCFCGRNNKQNEFMVQCDFCKQWFHGSCVDVKEYKVIEIDKYFCPQCSITCGPSILKPYTNWHRHDFWDVDADTKPVQTGTGVFIRELCSRHFASEGEIVVHMRGQQLTENYLRQHGFENPIVIDGKDGLDMTVPPSNFSLYDVESFIGGDKEIDVIDVMRQNDFKMTLRDFVEYFNSPNRTRVFNVISLEFSNTGLSPLVEAPLVVHQLDWVNSVWPRDGSENTFQRPQVQKYCLMSVKDSYTDFHIDFGGTSVWYHVLKGEKIFYFIRPTSANLTLYQQWMTSSTQYETFFGDQVDRCFKCILRQGQTMLIPTGWIHAVYTPADSLVFGGNFLHSLNIPMQLQIYDIEKKTKTHEKFKFPLFETINWYAAKKLMTILKELNSEEKKCPNNFLAGLKALLTVLKQWNTEKDYNMSNREQIPDTINSHKLLKDLGKEIRHAERFLISLNPPKPERESKRKRKRPMNKDFVDFSCPQNIYETNEVSDESILHTELTSPTVTPKKGRTTLSSINYSKVSLPKNMLYPYNKPETSGVKIEPTISTLPDDIQIATNSNERWVVTNVNPGDRPGTVLKLTLGSKPEPSDMLLINDLTEFKSNLTDIKNVTFDVQDISVLPKSVYDFQDDSDNRDDEFALKIDESVHKRKRNTSQVKNKQLSSKSLTFLTNVDSETPKNGIESLLKASALTTKFVDSGRASPSTREAIAGMLSIGQTYSSTFGLNSLSKPTRRRKVSVSKDHFEENIDKVHQDDEYIYPSLDGSDDEEFVFNRRGRAKVDEAWNPKARVGPLLPKMNRPAREGTKKQAVEKVLEAAAARRASESHVQDITQRRAYKKKKPKITTTPGKSFPNEPSFSSPHSSSPHPVSSTTKLKKGMKTAKQRLGKILKIHRMIH